MNVTILADASHRPQTLAGGYDFWIADAIHRDARDMLELELAAE